MNRVFSISAAVNARRRLPWLLISLIVVLVSCGGESGDTASKAAPLQPAEFNACDLLSAADAGRLMGEPVTKSDNTVQVSNSVSQCVHTFSEPRERLTLLIRHSKAGITPLSRAQEAEKQRSQTDDPVGGEMMAEVIEAGEDIEGIGDLAYAFDLAGINLWVFWGQNYQMTVTVSGVDDSAAALDIAKEAAQIVIGQF